MGGTVRNIRLHLIILTNLKILISEIKGAFYG